VFGLEGLPARPTTDDGLKMFQVNMLLGLVCRPVLTLPGLVNRPGSLDTHGYRSNSPAPLVSSA